MSRTQKNGAVGNWRQGSTGVNLDLTVPDTARMIDYWLGGDHHFQVDRTMAKKIEKITPIAPHWARIQRQFLARVTNYLFHEVGLKYYIVAGAGLPTCGNVHEVLPDAHVLYVDVNQLTVAYGKNILGDNPRTRYVNHDAREIHTLNAAELDDFFEGSRVIAFIYIGLSYFFPDDVLQTTMSECYEWASPGSHLGITSLGEDSLRYAAPSVEAYSRMGRPLFPRTTKETEEIVRPWNVTEHGVVAASHWGLRDVTEPSPPIYVYGCLAYKPS